MSKPLSLEQLDVFPSYKGGRTCVYGGYVWEFFPSHHLQNPWGWVAQHRLVAEDKIGRPLRQGKDPKFAEHAHHVDDCRTNNHPDNIEVMTKSEHHSHHSYRLGMNSRGARFPEEEVKSALAATGTIKGAARALGIHHMTIRNRWPHLISHIKRKSPLRTDDPKILQTIQEMALNPNYTIHDVAKAVGTDPKTISRVCVRHNFPWEGARPSINPHKMPTREGLLTRGILPGTVLPKIPQKKRKQKRTPTRQSRGAQLGLPLSDPQVWPRHPRS